MAKYDDTARILGLPEDATCAQCVMAIRRRTGLSQRAFASRYHIPRRSVESWESGERETTEYTLYLLARAVLADKETGR